MNFRSKKVSFDETKVDTISIAKGANKEIKDKKLSMMIASAVLLVTNILSLVYFVIVGFTWQNLLICSILVGLDIVHLVYSLVTNMRFRHSLVITGIYLLLNCLLTLALYFVTVYGDFFVLGHAYGALFLLVAKLVLVALFFFVWANTAKAKKNKSLIG
ncbi:MAG: hypothetical protein RR338_04505, partial [Clostridia bacterium]